jgi:Flp pilus assembly protein TadG
MPGPRNEKGANLVEFALVLPIVILVLLGILESGVAFRDFLTVSNAAKEGVRVVAAMGDDPNSDCVALAKTAASITTSIRIEQLVEVQIFRADANGNQIGSDTNTYSLDPGGDPADCADWNVNQYGWDPLDRNVVTGGTTPLDIAGVRIIYTHGWMTGFPPFNGSFTINEATVSRLEPEEYA